MIIRETKARSTGTTILLIDNRKREFMDDDQPWYTVCEEHAGLASHPTRALATLWCPEPEGWCPTCQEATE